MICLKSTTTATTTTRADNVDVVKVRKEKKGVQVFLQRLRYVSVHVKWDVSILIALLIPTFNVPRVPK